MLQQLATPRTAHGHPGGHLMTWSDIVVIAGTLIKHDPLFIHRMRHHLGVGEQKGVDGFAEAGVFDANAGGGREQQSGQQVEGILRAKGDENFIRRGDNAALGQHPGSGSASSPPV